MSTSDTKQGASRRAILGLGAGFAALACTSPGKAGSPSSALGRQKTATGRKDYPVLVGSANALAGMKKHYDKLLAGAEPLDVAIEVVKVVEADPTDNSVGFGGMPNEDGVVQLDAAVMDGRTHNAGSVGCIENIMHPSEVARLVMERTDHCMIVGRGAYEFAREHGHPHVELLTDKVRRRWLKWKENLSDSDDRFRTPEDDEEDRELDTAMSWSDDIEGQRVTGTIHCSALATSGEIACTTTTSGLSWKIPGRVGDSPIIGAGLYCDGEAGSAGATGRGEAAILSHGSSAIVELLRAGASPEDAGLEVMARVVRQAQRASVWQPGLVNEEGQPSFNLSFYVLGLDGAVAGVRLKGKSHFAVSDPEGGPRHMPTVSYLE
ncbi:MAG: N4-(beta-N-acetylglucosaminyl)-L-asparaginase [Planctomycetota bacterium]|jgi:N4-(beta-N-acetylglucosaminyl)-L-asparaginase